MADRNQHLDTIRAAWDAYHADYMAFHLKERPDFYEHFAKGGTTGLDDYVILRTRRRIGTLPAGCLLRVRRRPGLLLD